MTIDTKTNDHPLFEKNWVPFQADTVHERAIRASQVDDLPTGIADFQLCVVS